MGRIRILILEDQRVKWKNRDFHLNQIKKAKRTKIAKSKIHRQHQIRVIKHHQTIKRLNLHFFKSGLVGKVDNKIETNRLVANKKVEACHGEKTFIILFEIRNKGLTYD